MSTWLTGFLVGSFLWVPVGFILAALLSANHDRADELEELEAQTKNYRHKINRLGLQALYAETANETAIDPVSEASGVESDSSIDQ